MKTTMKQRKHHSQQGFTLIEILIVMLILGLLGGLVGPKLFKNVGKAKQGTAKTQIEMLMSSLNAYRLDVGKYPNQQEGLEALVKNPGNDKWDGPSRKSPPRQN